MMSKAEVLEWIAALPDDAKVAISEGGLALVMAGTFEEVYCEVGMEPENALELNYYPVIQRGGK